MPISTRRRFVQQTSMALLGSMLVPEGINKQVIMTVTGPIQPSAMKFTLVHEHILVDFIGAKEQNKNRYNAQEVFETALPFLKDVKSRGCFSLVECTPMYLGRDVQILHRLAKASGLNIVTNTGYYGATGEKYLPAHVYNETADQISGRWIDEWKNGIEGTGIKPGFIKTSVDKAPLTTTQRKIIDAAAITHLATGLTIGIHTGDGRAAKEQLEILDARQVLPSARIWIHAQNEQDNAYHVEAARVGSWISFDGVNPGTVTANVAYLLTMKREKLLGNVLVSQDAGWYHVGELRGGKFQHYNCIFTNLVPELKKNGFTPREIDTIFVKNPARALTVQLRKRSSVKQ